MGGRVGRAGQAWLAGRGFLQRFADGHHDFIGRFSSKKASLQTIYVQPNVAYQINDRWSIGGGPIYVNSRVELTQMIALENMRSRFNSAAGLASQGYSDVCELPLAVPSQS